MKYSYSVLKILASEKIIFIEVIFKKLLSKVINKQRDYKYFQLLKNPQNIFFDIFYKGSKKNIFFQNRNCGTVYFGCYGDTRLKIKPADSFRFKFQQ